MPASCGLRDGKLVMKSQLRRSPPLATAPHNMITRTMSGKSTALSAMA
jgi:hypothetical protein